MVFFMRRNAAPDRIAEHLQRYRLDDDRPNKETMIERLMRQALDQAQLRYTAQGRVGRYRPDFIVTIGTRRIIIECDGPVHRQPAQQRKDRIKDAVYVRSGYVVYRFRDDEIRTSPLACVNRVTQEAPPHAK